MSAFWLVLFVLFRVNHTASLVRDIVDGWSKRCKYVCSFQPPTVWCEPAQCEAGAAALETFTAAEHAALAALPAAACRHDLLLLATLHKKGYLRGYQHLEEIMFMENVSRSQLMQLLDKFRDVLITFETEDPAVAMLYPQHNLTQ